MLEKTRVIASSLKRKFRFKNKLYSIDSSVIDLCLSMYEWARFRRTKGAVKIQIWTALIAMLLLKHLKLNSCFGWSLSYLAALLRMNLFTYRDLWSWIDKPFETVPVQEESIQMELIF